MLFSIRGKHSNTLLGRPSISTRSKSRCPDVSRSAASCRTTSTRSTQTMCSLQTINLLPIFLVCWQRHTNGSSRTSPKLVVAFILQKSSDSHICHCFDTLDRSHHENIHANPWPWGLHVIIIRPEYHFDICV
jgi:hypothetical protein